MRKAFLFTAIAVLLTLPNGARAQAVSCDDEIKMPVRNADDQVSCDPEPQPSPLQLRALKYAAVALKLAVPMHGPAPEHDSRIVTTCFELTVSVCPTAAPAAPAPAPRARARR